jgi:hypothetical protein
MTTSPDTICPRCGNPKGGGWMTPIYGDPHCIPCLRAMEREEVEARGEKYERWYCSFGWDKRIGGSSCIGSNWEWTRNQIVDGLTCKDEYFTNRDGGRWRWDWVSVNGPGMSLQFTRDRMPGELWGDVVETPSLVGKTRGWLRQVLGLQ